MIAVIWSVVLGIFLSSAAGAVISVMTDGSADMKDSAVTASSSSSSAAPGEAGLEEFIASNPFQATVRRASAPPPPPKPVQEVEAVPASRVLDGIIVRATFPGVGAWIEQNGAMKLMLIGHTIERYRLSSVKYDMATFRSGHSTVKKYITYGPAVEEPVPAAPAPQPQTASRPAQPDNGNITAPSGGTEGTIPSEVVKSLVQNPFDELKRIRMRPNEKGGGLEVQWIQNDSILKRLGVQRGDVIRSVNGIPFTSMGDIANSINSLITSERFDVEVTRGGKAEALRYVVK